MDVTPIVSDVDGYNAFQCASANADSRPLSYRVLMSGAGPPVILMHELRGAGDAYLTFASQLRREGYQTWLPIFFEPAGSDIGTRRGLAQLCVRQELRCLLLGRPTPLASWLRELAAYVTSPLASNSSHSTVAVIGMCMTGGLAFALLWEPSVSAAVAAQPSLPLLQHLPVEASNRANAAEGAAPLMILRFDGDRICRRSRLETALETFGSEPRRRTQQPPLVIEQRGPVVAVEARGSDHATLTYDADATNGATVDAVLGFLQQHHTVRGVT